MVALLMMMMLVMAIHIDIDIVITDVDVFDDECHQLVKNVRFLKLKTFPSSKFTKKYQFDLLSISLIFLSIIPHPVIY